MKVSFRNLAVLIILQLLFCTIYQHINTLGTVENFNSIDGNTEFSLTTPPTGNKTINWLAFRSLLFSEGQFTKNTWSFDSEQFCDSTKTTLGYFSKWLQQLALLSESATQLIIPSLNILVIIFPFHSFL
ncbi:hypothetical protein [Membranihabitans maritimus]|uniref:hypothetical protein n=1 Tax=Membranihabitans maritimus TaxID=2904244 RepID=UPI001F275098|nr:hypothetical protein [Membranihabitans maritimus]